MKPENETIAQAEHEVQHRNDDVENALNHLQEKLEDGVQKVAKYKKAAQNPFFLMGTAVVIGIFLGKLLKITFSKKH